MNLVDIIIVIIIALGAFKGFKRGLINTLGGLFGWAVALVLAVIYNTNFKSFLDQQFGLTAKLGDWLGERFPLPAGVDEASSSAADIELVVESLPMPAFMQDILSDKATSLSAQESGPESLSMVFGHGIAEMLVIGLSFLLLFFIISFIIKILLKIVSKGVGVTPLRGINRIGGFIVGAGLYSFILAVVIGVIYPFLAATDTFVSEQIKTSTAVDLLMNIYGQISSYILSGIIF